MAEHNLLSSIYSVVNSLVPPKNHGRGHNCVNDKRVDSLKDLTNGKKLCKLLKCEPQDAKSESAKQAIADVLIGYEDLHIDRVKNISYQLKNLFNQCEEDFDVFLNLVVLIICIAHRLPNKIWKNKRERVENQLVFIDSYYTSVVHNFSLILKGKPFKPLIDMNVETDLYSQEMDLNSQHSLDSLLLHSLSDTENEDTIEVNLSSQSLILISQPSSDSLSFSHSIIDNCIESSKSKSEPSVNETSIDSKTEDIKSQHLIESVEEQNTTHAIQIASQSSSVCLTPPTTPQTPEKYSSMKERSPKRGKMESSDESDSNNSERQSPIRIQINSSCVKKLSTPKKRKRMKCCVSYKTIIKAQEKVITTQDKLLENFQKEIKDLKSGFQKEIQDLKNTNKTLEMQFKHITQDNKQLKEKLQMSCNLDEIINYISDDGFKLDPQIEFNNL